MATLQSMSQQLAYVTGRRGLELDTVLCTRLLNEACRHLDTLQDHPQTVRRAFAKPASGEAVILLPDLRAVISVWASDGSQRGKLEFIENYEDGKALGFIGSAEMPDGCPMGYSLYPAGLAPHQYGSSASDFETAEYDANAYADIVFAHEYSDNAIQIFPASDGSWTLDISAKWWSRKLTDTVLTNWWSVNYPSTVVFAAARQFALERANPELAAEWDRAMQDGLRSIDVALAESEFSAYEAATDLYMRG